MSVPSDVGELESLLLQHGFVRRPLTDKDIAIGAGIQISKVTGAYSGPTTYRKTTAKTVNTTTTATDLLNGEIAVGAGVMGTSGLARMTAWGDFLNNSGGAATSQRFQLLFGGTTILDTGASGSWQALATRGYWKIVVEIFNLGVANSQSIDILIHMSGGVSAAAASSFTTGNGAQSSFGAGTWGTLKMGGANTAAKDTSSSQAIVLNVINGSASATYETKLLGALVEIL